MEIESELKSRFGHNLLSRIVRTGLLIGALLVSMVAGEPSGIGVAIADEPAQQPGSGQNTQPAVGSEPAPTTQSIPAADVPAGRSGIEAPDVPAGRSTTIAPDVPAGRSGIEAPDVPAGRDNVMALDVSAGHKNTQTIETGNVQFTVTRDGRWVAFTPAWAGVSTITSGGFALYAAGNDGRMTELVNTARGGLRVAGGSTVSKKCSEGTAGGFRAPSPDPDDDRDGLVDEDWLDGVDNDGDGNVDEDFAAIGDQMIATSYCTPGVAADVAGGSALTFQQEAYAWSLPHIDGAVMVSLRARNVGTEPLEDVRIAAFFRKSGPFGFEAREVDPPKSAAWQGSSQIFVCEDGAGTAMGLVAFPVSDLETPWTGEIVVGDAIDRPEDDKSMPEAAGALDTAGASNVAGTRVEDAATVRVLSPVIDLMEPGDVIRVDIALVAVDNTQEISQAAAIAYETFIGDGDNKYLPPPVSMTPRVIWGTYRFIEAHDTNARGAVGAMGAAGAADTDGAPPSEGILIDFEPLGDEPVSPGDISYFSGLEPGSVIRREIQPGVEQLVVRGEAVEELALKGERIVFKGRLEDGEFFEAILRPDEGAAALGGARNGADIEAELYWKKEGRLNQDLLNSSPNPFRDVTSISYEVPSVIEKEDGSFIRSTESLETSVKVYNVVGRLVSVLVEDIFGPGVHTTDWQAVDDNGNPVASGVYYVKLQVGKKYITKRLILLK